MIKIDYKFTSLNEYINAERINKYKANNIKQKETNLIAFYANLFPNIKKYPVKIYFIWHINNKNKDLDNQAFAKKFIIDGLVKSGVLKSDNINHIIEYNDKVIYDKNEYVEIEIKH